MKRAVNRSRAERMHSMSGALTTAVGETIIWRSTTVGVFTHSIGAFTIRNTAKYLSVAVAVAVTAAAAAAVLVIATYGINPGSVTRPPDSKPFASEPTKLLEVGTARHGDTSLSPIGRSCNTCHLAEDSYNATFNKPYPHYVQSVRWKTSLSQITAEGMVQFCMVSAMEGKPLPWDSETLAALTAFVLERHRKALGRTSAAQQTSGANCGTPPG